MEILTACVMLPNVPTKQFFFSYLDLRKSYFRLFLEAMHFASRRPLKGPCVSSQKALKGSETSRRRRGSFWEEQKGKVFPRQ